MIHKSSLLQGITWDHPRGYAPLEALAPEIEARFGVKISWTRRSLREFGDTSVTELAGRFDMLIIDHPHCGQAARDGVLLPLDTLLTPEERSDLTANPVGPSLASYQLNGHLWALPIDAAMQSACLRPDLTDHFPVSWDELLSSDIPFAIPLCPTDVFCCFLTLCAQAGLAVSSRCLHPENAVRAAAWLCSGQCQSGAYLQHQGQPAHGQAWCSETPFFRDLRDTLEQAFLRPRVPGWNAFQEAAGEQLHASLKSKTPIPGLIANLRAEWVASRDVVR